MKKLLCLLLGALVSTSSMAADWVTVAKGNIGKTDLDVSSLKKESNGNLTYWTKDTYFHEPRERVTLKETSCAKKQTRYLSTINYRNGLVYDVDHTISDWIYAIPDTIGGNVVNSVCSNSF